MLQVRILSGLPNEMDSSRLDIQTKKDLSLKIFNKEFSGLTDEEKKEIDRILENLDDEMIDTQLKEDPDNEVLGLD